MSLTPPSEMNHQTRELMADSTRTHALLVAGAKAAEVVEARDRLGDSPASGAPLAQLADGLVDSAAALYVAAIYEGDSPVGLRESLAKAIDDLRSIFMMACDALSRERALSAELHSGEWTTRVCDSGDGPVVVVNKDGMVLALKSECGFFSMKSVSASSRPPKEWSNAFTADHPSVVHPIESLSAIAIAAESGSGFWCSRTGCSLMIFDCGLERKSPIMRISFDDDPSDNDPSDECQFILSELAQSDSYDEVPAVTFAQSIVDAVDDLEGCSLRRVFVDGVSS